jgi:alpha-L-rhamnosidase
MLNFDMAAFYTKFLRDIRLSQRKDGSLPDAVPPYIQRFYPADPAWGSAYITIAWHMYMMEGDLRLLKEHFSSMKRYVGFLRKNAEQHILRRLGKYGDWCPPGSILPKQTPVELTSTWYYYHDVYLLSRIAAAIGAAGDKKYYTRLAGKIKEAFTRQFLEGDQYAARRTSGADTSASQTSNLLPLYMRMVPPKMHDRVLETLMESLLTVRDCHLDTGILGTCYLLDVLTEEGYGEAAFRIVTQRSYPGWGYMVSEGATTLWERWEKITGGGMNSHNHIMLGSVDAWFYRVIAGVVCTAPGWSRLRIKPHSFGELRFAAATLRTLRGEIGVSWERSQERFEMRVHIPVGVEAEVCVPLVAQGLLVRETGVLLWDRGSPRAARVPGVTFTASDAGYVRFTVRSGSYTFVAEKRVSSS